MKQHRSDARRPGLGVAEDAAEYWLRRVERGTAHLCDACGGVRDDDESKQHGCNAERRRDEPSGQR